MRLSKPLSACALSLTLAACAGSETLIPLTEGGALGAFQPIQNSRQAPCSVQKAIAAHNSVYDTMKTKRAIIYKAPCEIDKPKGSAPEKVASLANG